jgi:cytochrome c oxidase subunit 1
LTFDPQHVAGILDAAAHLHLRRRARLKFTVSSVGAIFQALGLLCVVANLLVSLRRGALAGDDPWDAWTLEWTTTSPPPEYNFETLPVVRSRRPLWDLKHPEDPDWKYE